MNALAKLKAHAESDETFDSKAVEIDTKDFDPRYWLRWAHGLGYGIHLWADYLGQHLPRGVETPTAQRSKWAMQAALHCPGNDKKLADYLRAIAPEHEQGMKLEIRWRTLMHQHARRLPVIVISKVHVTSKITLPRYVWNDAEIEADRRSAEFVAAKKLELLDRLARYERQIRYTPKSKQGAFNAAFRAARRADKMRLEAGLLTSQAQHKFANLIKTHHPLAIGGEVLDLVAA